VHIVDATAERGSAAGLGTVGLLGTNFTIEDGFYQERMQTHGLRVLVPGEADRRLVHRVIFEELCAGVMAIARLRTGSYLPSFLEPRRRAKQALVAVVQEAYVNAVSTRKVDRLVEQMGLHHLGKDQVSRLCRGLDEQVRIFRERPLEGAYPYLWLDAKVERVREPSGVRHKALVIAHGVHESGRREVIGLDVGEAETESFWRAFLRSLRERGLDGVRLCISDAHAGLKAAIAQVLGCPWQRCTVHSPREGRGGRRLDQVVLR
jgi:putative transposase